MFPHGGGFCFSTPLYTRSMSKNSKNSSLSRTLKDGWKALSKGQKKVVGGLAAVDAAGKALALRDLARTDSRRVRGPKFLWAPLIGAVNTLGWAAYFLVGKKR